MGPEWATIRIATDQKTISAIASDAVEAARERIKGALLCNTKIILDAGTFSTVEDGRCVRSRLKDAIELTGWKVFDSAQCHLEVLLAISAAKGAGKVELVAS